MTDHAGHHPRPAKTSAPVTYTPEDGLLLEVEDLYVEFHTPRRRRHARSTASRSTCDQGETLAILGESGSGKSVTAQAIMGILDMPPAVIPDGHDPLLRPGPALDAARSSAGDPRPGDLDDLPGRPVLAEPGLPGRLADRRDVPDRTGASNKSDALAAGHRAHGAGPDPGRARARQGLPAPVLRRHAPAHHDRDGHRARPGGAHRRRADHRPRRHRPGADHGAARRSSRRSARWG